MNDSDSMLDLLIRHELALAGLYATCGQVFPEHSDFWNTLVLEEKAHAQVLKTLQTTMLTQQVFLNARKFNRIGLQTAIDYANKQRRAVLAGEHAIMQALIIALDIERAIIEKDFFEVFESDLAVMKHEFRELRDHTLEHSNRITAMIETLRASGIEND